MLALRWWREVFELELCEQRPWAKDHRKQVHLFCDARSTPPRLAAVLFIEVMTCFAQFRVCMCVVAVCLLCQGQPAMYTDMAPPAMVMQNFAAREDGQIMGLEILSICLGARIVCVPAISCASAAAS